MTNWLIYQGNRELSIEPSTQRMLNLVLIVLAGAINIGVQFLQRAINSRRDVYYEEGEVIELVIDGALVISFYMLLWVIYPYTYPKEKDTGPIIRNDIYYAVQLSIFKDLLYLLYVGFEALKVGTIPNSELSVTIYGFLYSIYVILTILYFMKEVLNRLNESFESYNNAIIGALVISAIVFWSAFGLNWIIGVLVKLPFEVSV